MSDSPTTEERFLRLQCAALALVAVARRNTDAVDEWDAAIKAVEKECGVTKKFVA